MRDPCFDPLFEPIQIGPVVMVTSRTPEDSIYQALVSDADRLARAGIVSVDAIGDCVAPGTIAMAVSSGHRMARGLDASPANMGQFKRELVDVVTSAKPSLSPL